MKKTFLSIISALFIASSVNAADLKYGVSVAYTMIDATGSEKEATETTNASASNEVTIGSIFIENNFGNFSLGLDYIPFKADVNSATKTRSETSLQSGNSTTTITNKAQAEISNHITAYALYPFSNGAFLKLGVAQVNVDATESLETGSKYGDDTIYGGQIGLGFGNDNWRLAVEYTDYEEVSLTSSTNSDNKITADLDTTAIKLSYNF